MLLCQKVGKQKVSNGITDNRVHVGTNSKWHTRVASPKNNTSYINIEVRYTEKKFKDHKSVALLKSQC